MTTVGNVGLGLIILAIVWIFAVISFIVAVKYDSHLGWICLGAAVLFTIVLLVIPTEKENDFIEEYLPQDKDYTLIYKYILLISLIICAAFVSVIFFLIHCIQPIRPKNIKSFEHVSF